MAKVYMLLLLTLTIVSAKSIVLSPDSEATGTEIGLLWVQGAQCDPNSYVEIATEFQTYASTLGYKPWVAISDFTFSTPDPVTFGWMYSDAVADMQTAGLTDGQPIFIAAHSLGGVMTQLWAKGNADKVKGIALMGSVLLRDHKALNAAGNTEYDFPIPTLQIGGTRDGLMRISRVAEEYWHSSINIEASQANRFPVLALEGVAHHSFMSAPYPSFVVSSDLSSQVSDAMAHTTVGKAMANFFHQQMTGSFQSELTGYQESTKDILAPLITAMELEGNYNLKPPCYNYNIVNQPSPSCFTGSKWNDGRAQTTMAGDLKGVQISENDNFHRVESVTPIHLPQFNNTCSYGDSSCIMYSLSVTENYYEKLDELDTGKVSVAAYEIKTKLKSRQSSQIAAGFENPQFNQTDESSICGEINQLAIEWAKENAGSTARSNYDATGTQLVIGDDLGPYNAGPLWIWTYMKYTDSDDKKTCTVQSPMMRTPIDYPVSAAAGFHYCKILSPYKVMEYIYVDSQYAFNKFDPSAEDVQEELTFLSK